jgi:predicted regulator of Ras-like GTPase activity (Roadblock/LC7/MglB family)
MVDAHVKELDWLLDDLINRLAGAESAVVLSADGLLMGRTHGMAKEDAEQLSAMASAFQSLARGVGRQFDKGGVRQTVVELDRAFLIVTAAGQGACLALLATENADMGMVAYEMNVLVHQVGEALAAEPRTAAGVFGNGRYDLPR